MVSCTDLETLATDVLNTLNLQALSFCGLVNLSGSELSKITHTCASQLVSFKWECSNLVDIKDVLYDILQNATRLVALHLVTWCLNEHADDEDEERAQVQLVAQIFGRLHGKRSAMQQLTIENQCEESLIGAVKKRELLSA